MIINSQINPTYNTEVPPGLRALDGTVLPLTNVVAEGRLCNGLFQMSVEQHYRNTGHSNLETVYTFPLIPDAVLLGLELQIGERRLAGKAVPVSVARQDYEDALEDGNSAALLEKAADGLYTVSLGNLLAGETASIRYQYAQPICAKNGTLRITIPTTVAPRYGTENRATYLSANNLLGDCAAQLNEAVITAAINWIGNCQSLTLPIYCHWHQIFAEIYPRPLILWYVLAT